jgi:hypothetical protein
MEQLPNFVGQRLAKGEPGPHPDPDQLNAFSENSLRAHERASVLAHLSLCGECREILCLAQPISDEALSPNLARTPWLSWPVLRWGAAVACVAIVGAAISIYRQQPAKYRDERDAVTLATPSSRDELKASAPTAKAVEPAENAAKDEGAPTPARAAGRLDSPAPAPAKSLAKAASPPATPAQTELLDQASSEVDKKEDLAGGKAKQATAAEMSAASAANIATMDRKVAAGASLASAIAPRWTLNADGTLQRSLDGGKTWSTIPVSSNAAFRVVAALGSDVWVGGPRGSLFHSADAGEHWSKVTPSDGKNTLADDITAIQFSDSTHGRVTSASDEVWATEDGGTTWQQLW